MSSERMDRKDQSHHPRSTAISAQGARSEHCRAQTSDDDNNHYNARGNIFLCLNELPRMPPLSPPSASPARRTSTQQSPFLKLPTEIRLHIYSLLVLPRRASDLLPSYEKVNASTHDSFDYDKKVPGTDQSGITDLARPTLLIRTIDPERHRKQYPSDRPQPLRSTYSVRCDRFRSACRPTTYHCVNNPRLEDQLALLRTNQQIHAEAAELLYSTYTFDFDTHVEAIVPFLSDLTQFARSCLKSLRLVKRALAYEKDFDRAEWSTALRYLTSASASISLNRLELGIVAGRPGGNGWDRIAAYTAQDFRLLRQLEGMEWMQYLLEIEGLRELVVRAVVEHCPPATTSMAMAGYIRFSASVETGFAEFLVGELVGVQA